MEKINREYKKVLVYENSSGFGQYSHKICNTLVENDSDLEVHYLTDYKNVYLNMIDQRVVIATKLKVPAPIKGKRIKWAINRLYVAVSNILIRNKYIIENKIDVVNIQSTLSTVEQFFVKRLCKKNCVVMTVHDVIPPIKSLYWSKNSLKILYDNMKDMIVHSIDNKQQLMKEFGVDEKRINVIHHGTDLEYKRIDRKECFEHFGLPYTEEKVFLFFGLIREQKGLDDLIKAVNNMNSPCKILVAGAMPNGEDYSKYKSLIKDPDNYFEMIRFVDEADIDYLYGMSDAVVFPYKYFSSQSGVFMQSIKYRKPIIATNVSSFKQYVNEYEIGLISEPNDPEGLRKNLESFVSMPEEEVMSIIKNMEKAAYDNSWEKAGKMYLDCFDRAYAGYLKR